jgi:hypothetical protein
MSSQSPPLSPAGIFPSQTFEGWLEVTGGPGGLAFHWFQTAIQPWSAKSEVPIYIEPNTPCFL